MREIIVRKMIEDGIMSKVILPKLEDNELKAYIGEHWFYFGGHAIEEIPPQNIPFSLLVSAIKETLDDFRNQPEFEDEYLYYYYYLCENI